MILTEASNDEGYEDLASEGSDQDDVGDSSQDEKDENDNGRDESGSILVESIAEPIISRRKQHLCGGRRRDLRRSDLRVRC